MHAFFSRVCNVNALHANTNSTHFATCSFHNDSIRYSRPTRVCLGFENCYFIFPAEIELIINTTVTRACMLRDYYSTALCFSHTVLIRIVVLIINEFIVSSMYETPNKHK